MPILHIEGAGEVSQCNAILLYIGRLHDLHPSDPWQAALHEQLLSAGEELRGKVFPLLGIKGDEERKGARRANHDVTFITSGVCPASGQEPARLRRSEVDIDGCHDVAR